MKAKLLKEQLGLPAGTELDVVSEGRAVVLAGPAGQVVVAAEDVEILPEPEKDPSLLVNILAPEPETSEPETAEDDDLDEPLPDPQPDCDGESCESCQ